MQEGFASFLCDHTEASLYKDGNTSKLQAIFDPLAKGLESMTADSFIIYSADYISDILEFDCVT